MPTTTTTSYETDTPASRHSTRSMRDVAQNAMSTETLIDIVQRLGLVDILVNRLRARVEASDVDEMIDDATNYFRRNPEMVVVALGTLTVAAAAVVFLTSRDEDDDRPSTRSTRSAARDDIDMTPALGRTSTSGAASTGSRSRSTGSRRTASTRE